MRTCQRQINFNNRLRERKSSCSREWCKRRIWSFCLYRRGDCHFFRRDCYAGSFERIVDSLYLFSICWVFCVGCTKDPICVGCTCFNNKIMNKSKQIDWHLRNFDQLSTANSSRSIAKAIAQLYCVGSRGSMKNFWVDKSARSNKWISLIKLMPPVAICCHKSPELSNEANLVKIRFIYCEKMFKKK